MIRSLGVFLLVLALAPGNLFGEEKGPTKPLGVGDKAPNFVLPSASGDKVELASLLEKGPVVVTWYRGGWCPFCNRALSELATKHDDIEEAGGTLVAITPEKPEKAKATSGKNDVRFPILSDAGNEVAAKYGLRFRLPDATIERYRDRLDLAAFNGDDSWTLPHPATYVISQDGVIAWAYTETDYRNRAKPADILRAVRAAKAPAGR